VDDEREVCLCFHVSLGKIRRYLEREKPAAASLISECLGAGTACGWCIPHLRELHRKFRNGEEMTLDLPPDDYAEKRLRYQQGGSSENKPGKET